MKPVACVASVSIRVIARKLEREQKKKKMEGGRGREKRKPSVPSPSPFIPFFFVLVPVFLTNSSGTACYAGYETSVSINLQGCRSQYCWSQFVGLVSKGGRAKSITIYGNKIKPIFCMCWMVYSSASWKMLTSADRQCRSFDFYKEIGLYFREHNSPKFRNSYITVFYSYLNLKAFATQILQACKFDR